MQLLSVLFLLLLTFNARAEVCNRSPAMRASLKQALNKKCAEITPQDLATLTTLGVFSEETILDVGDLEGLSGLKKLIIMGQQITLPDGIFASVPNLENLVLTTPPQSFSNRTLQRLNALKVLTLENLPAMGLPGNILEGVSNLEELTLNYVMNQGATLDSGLLRNQVKLKYLALRGSFSSLPVELLANQSTLTNLAIDSHDGAKLLKTIPAGLFSHTTSLKYLRLSELGLEQLPHGIFSGLSALTSLSLSYNSFKTLPFDLLIGLDELSYLDLKATKLQQLDAGLFKANQKLTDITLAANFLTALPDGLFQGLTNLKKLDFENNQLKSVKASLLADMPALEDLNLEINTIDSLESMQFSGNPLLKSVNLYSNNLSEIPADAFRGLAKVRELSLSFNKLNTLPPGIFTEVGSELAPCQKGILLYGNKFTKDEIDRIETENPEFIIYSSIDPVRRVCRGSGL